MFGVDLQRLLLAGVVTAKQTVMSKTNGSRAQRRRESWVGLCCSLCGDVFSCLVGLSLHDPLHVS